MRRTPHISDDRLVDVCLDRTATSAEEAHLAACDGCGARRSRLELMLREMTDAAAADTDEVFTPERLAAQQDRILHRIEQDGRPARVIAFPAALAPELRPLRNRPAARWIAGAAAAGLTIGLLAGHLAHDLPGIGRPIRIPTLRSAAPRPAAGAGVRVVAVSINDEQLLGEIEHALEGPPLAVLRPLHDLTPR
jgi:anti-sigma factor RsiW